jgi:hypothetical protein
MPELLCGQARQSIHDSLSRSDRKVQKKNNRKTLGGGLARPARLTPDGLRAGARSPSIFPCGARSTAPGRSDRFPWAGPSAIKRSPRTSGSDYSGRSTPGLRGRAHDRSDLAASALAPPACVALGYTEDLVVFIRNLFFV